MHLWATTFESRIFRVLNPADSDSIRCVLYGAYGCAAMRLR